MSVAVCCTPKIASTSSITMIARSPVKSTPWMRSKNRGNMMPAAPNTIMMPAVAENATETVCMSYAASTSEVVNPNVRVKIA